MAFLPPPCSALPEEPLLPIEERRRAVELSRYFQATSIRDEEWPADAGIRHPPNSMLVALCQLGALRLDCNRAFISLLDHSRQYIIGEATRSTGLVRPDEHVENHGLMLGFSAHPIEFGVCPETVKIFSASEGTADLRTPNITATKSYYIIRDFNEDERFRDRSYVSGWPHFRSYAEVPLISPNGYVIGSYCVIDDKPRDFTSQEVDILSDIASTVMDHLNLMKTKLDKERADCLVHGIGSYVDGAKQLRQRPAQAEAASSIPSAPHDRLDPAGGSVDGLLLAVPSGSASTRPTTYFSQMSGSQLGTPSEGTADESFNKDSTTGFDMPVRGETAQAGPVKSVPNVNPAISAAFDRASRIIRQAMDLHGIAFLDASVGPRNVGSTAARQGNHQTTDVPNCGLFAASTKSAEMKGDQDTDGSFALDQNLMRLLLVKYPLGQVFTFDRFGSVSGRAPGRDAAQATSAPGSSYDALVSKRRQDIDADGIDEDSLATQLFACMGVACSIAFFPLWDFQQERHFAGGIAWTTDLTRVLDQDDLNYFAAFGHSIMAETLKVQASALSSAKSDFISSISHEMRSPLHGILASLELLQDTLALDFDSSTMLGNAYGCATMLLDTMNNLLDFARINRLSSDPQRGVRKDGRPGQYDLRLASADLASLTEDVVSAVHISYASTFRRRGRRDNLHAATLSRPSNLANPDKDVAVLVRIEHFTPWNYRTDVGAWKRIIMNLVANALRYTELGYVEVGLEHITAVRAQGLDLPIGEHVCLQVNDSGRGISQEYLKHKLFTPFTQENNLSVGTGLGLSIVRQIVESLQGTIDIQSELGVGTRVTVRIPVGDTLAQASPELTKLDPYARLRGRTVILAPRGTVGLDPRETKGYAVNTPSQATIVQDHLMATAQAWLGMNVVVDITKVGAAGATAPSGEPPIQLVGNDDRIDSSFNVQLYERDRGVASSTAGTEGDVPRRSDITLSHPLGPMNLARVLLRAVAVVEEVHLSADHEAPTALDSVAQEKPGTKLSVPDSNGNKTANVAHDNNNTDETSAAPMGSKIRTKSRDRSPDHPATIEPRSQPATESLPAEARRLLLVDDNDINLKLLVTCARKEKCDYQSASNGLEALEIFKAAALSRSPAQPAFDLVIMDLSMPIMDGCAATREIRAFESSSGAPRARIMALTALGSETARERAWASGIDTFVTKPLSVRQMREICR
ncbi:hypothetical protein LTR56_002821 [Elasticomyces elasticus]|nr:hypothetical protein LTR56_002821 [Elasticomyces elasticus]KAK3666722.1 hypothetical protein LTR22_002309 [Elasticomyces elasticus]KAK4920436.1 hypothetical protein LTR49_012028 [Elasticomyces elasticus]KAK5759277.1 hypothetical protein LTS12_010600 [Elasticomyces elasticus]